MAGSGTGTIGTDPRLPSTRTRGPLGSNRDAGDPGTPPWFVGDTEGPTGDKDHAAPDSTMCRLRASLATRGLAPTLSDAREGRVSRFEFGELEQMSGRDFVAMPSAEVRRKWIQSKLGPYEQQLYESADTYHIPVQLLAVIIANELLDINILDILQEKIEFAWSGSFGIAEIQVDTALKDKLIPEDDPFRLAKACGMERVFVKGRLQVPQFAIDAAAKEIGLLVDRMRANPESAWLKSFGLDLKKTPAGTDIYGSFDAGSQEEREAALAEIVSAAYNSPDIIIAKHPETYKNAPIHGKNASILAQVFYTWQLFRAAVPLDRYRIADGDTAPGVTGASPPPHHTSASIAVKQRI